MSANKRTVKKSKQGRPPAGPIDWKMPTIFYPTDVDRTFGGVLLCLKKMGRRRWPAWEKYVETYARWCERGLQLGLEYAREIVRRRWPEIEPEVIRHWSRLAEYLTWRGFAVGTGPLESLILHSKKHDILDRAHAALLYATIVRKRRWEEGEPVILKATGASYDAYAASRLAENYRKRFFPRRVWPALQERIRQGRCTPEFVVQYSRITGKKCHEDANEGLLKANRDTEGFTELLWDYVDGALGRKLPDDLDAFMVLKSFENDPFVKKYVETYCA